MSYSLPEDPLFKLADQIRLDAARAAHIKAPRFQQWEPEGSLAGYCAKADELLLEKALAQRAGVRGLQVIIAHETGHARQRRLTLYSRRLLKLARLTGMCFLLVALMYPTVWYAFALCGLLVVSLSMPLAMWKELDADRFAARYVKSSRRVVATLLRTYRELDRPRDWHLYLRIWALRVNPYPLVTVRP